jgi:hypothetical protein
MAFSLGKKESDFSDTEKLLSRGALKKRFLGNLKKAF